MPIPQVNDRIKEAPAVMLRAVFAGVGQLLLAADKVRARAAETGWPPDRAAPKGQPRAQSRWHTLDDTRSGTVPLARDRANSHNHSAQRPPATPGSATAAPAPARTEAAVTPAPARADASVSAPAGTEEERPVPAAPATDKPAAPAAPTGDTPPLPGYDDLAFASLRARMSVLDAATLRTWLAYEQAHAHRDNVIAMFERRLAKIDAT
jgi:hypothetical protein